MMTVAHRTLVFAVLVLGSGCSKAELSESRKNHLLAGDHGWVDLVVGAAPAGPPVKNTDRACLLTVKANGETLLEEGADYRTAAAAGTPIGYRFPVPSGTLDLELTLARCVGDALVFQQKLEVGKDRLVELALDGKAVTPGASSPYVPASLDTVRARVDAVDAATAQATARVAALERLVQAGLLVNIGAVLVLLWRRKRP